MCITTCPDFLPQPPGAARISEHDNLASRDSAARVTDIQDAPVAPVAPTLERPEPVRTTEVLSHV
jgi:hypothetical protein